MDAVIICHFLVFPALFGQFAFFDADIVEAVVKIFTRIDRVFFKQVMQVALGIIVGCGQVFCKKNLYGQRLG
jgi:hypothetical protein